MGQFAEIIQKYASETFSQSLMHAIEGYPKLYEEPEVSEVLAKEIYGDRFLAAFSAEYGISPDECKEIFSELVEIALENDTVVLITNLQELKDRLG